MSPAPAFNTYLVGNGRWCSCCYPGGRPKTVMGGHVKPPRTGCNECCGAGRIAFTVEQIVAETVAEARAWRGRVA